jgi:hypothetical protein
MVTNQIFQNSYSSHLRRETQEDLMIQTAEKNNCSCNWVILADDEPFNLIAL